MGFFHIATTGDVFWSANWIKPFVPTGVSGIFMGAFTMFFAYIGFDALATAAEETKDPQKNLPIGIIGSLLVCTVVYVLVALVFTGVAPLNEININADVELNDITESADGHFSFFDVSTK